MKRICDAPVAITSNGDIILNLSHSNGLADPKALLPRALDAGRPVFIGTVLSSRETKDARKWIDDSSWELAGTIFGGRGARRRR